MSRVRQSDLGDLPVTNEFPKMSSWHRGVYHDLEGVSDCRWKTSHHSPKVLNCYRFPSKVSGWRREHRNSPPYFRSKASFCKNAQDVGSHPLMRSAVVMAPYWRSIRGARMVVIGGLEVRRSGGLEDLLAKDCAEGKLFRSPVLRAAGDSFEA